MDRHLIISTILAVAFPSAVFGADRAVLEDIREAWNSQETAVATMVVNFYMIRDFGLPGLGAYSDDKFDKAISALLKDVENRPADDLARDAARSLFGRALDQRAEATFAYDGQRIREDFAGDTQVWDGKSRVLKDRANNVVSIRDRVNSRRAILNKRNFRFLPSTVLLDRVEDIIPHPRAASFVTLVSRADNGDRDRTEVDYDTGDVYRLSSTRAKTGALGIQIIQADFREFAGGARMPFFKLNVKYDAGGNPSFAELIVVRSMEINVDVPEEKFRVSGTRDEVVFDYRGRGEKPGRSYRIEQAEEDDVVKYADGEYSRVKKLMAPVAAGKSNFTRIIVAANLIGVAVLVCVLLIRHKLRRRLIDESRAR